MQAYGGIEKFDPKIFFTFVTYFLSCATIL
nr:MAG TPA: hypothetical protein [Caudoviricetes sp.]